MKEIIIDGVTYICTPKEEVKVEHEFVDLGLPSGRLWATCNIGAEKPTDYGDYFACGAVEPYNIIDCDTNRFNGTDAAKLHEMDDKHDAAKVLWGDDWRMPTLTDFAELIDNCTCGMEVIDGITCGVFTSKVNSQNIIMPAAGYFDGGALISRGSYCHYWIKPLYSSSYVLSMYINQEGWYLNELSRYYGLSVRPVRC